MPSNELHRRLAGAHEARVVGTEEVEVDPERHGFQLQLAESLGEHLEFIHGRMEEESYLHGIEADGGDGLRFGLQLGSGTALEHHAQANVVFSRFLCQEICESVRSDRRCSGGGEKMPS